MEGHFHLKVNKKVVTAIVIVTIVMSQCGIKSHKTVIFSSQLQLFKFPNSDFTSHKVTLNLIM